MSAFGYGNSYQPNGSSAPTATPMGLGFQNMANPMPSPPQDLTKYNYSMETPAATPFGQPFGVPVNFNPDANSPWKDPKMVQVGSKEWMESPDWSTAGLIGGGLSGGFGGALSGYVGGSLGETFGFGGKKKQAPIYKRLNFEDPMQKSFNQPLLDSGEGMEASLKLNPKNPQDLYNTIKNMSYDQLKRVDNSWGSFQNQFAGAAQNYANAFANKTFKNEAKYTEDWAQNWLQSAYQELVRRRIENNL